MSPERLQHVQRVAALALEWAERLGVPDSERNRWLRAVWLHDALRDAPDAVLEEWAGSIQGPPELRHGPARTARSSSPSARARAALAGP